MAQQVKLLPPSLISQVQSLYPHGARRKQVLQVVPCIDISTHTQPIKCNLIFSKEYTPCRQSPTTLNKGQCVKINPAAPQSKDSPGRHAPVWFCSLWIILYKLILTLFDSYLIVRSDYLQGPAGSQTDTEKATKEYYRLELCTAWSYICQSQQYIKNMFTLLYAKIKCYTNTEFS